MYDRLVQRFGEENVFKDLDSMEPGADFAQVIEDTVASCDAVLVVIGSDWVSPRLEDPDDWVRLEVAHALAREVRVVPVLVEGAQMPASTELPDDLSALPRRHAVDLSETGWHAQVGELMDRLEASMGVVVKVPVEDLMANFRARMEGGDEPGAGLDFDEWTIEVLTNTAKEREFELRFREWHFPITLHKGKLVDKVTVEGHTVPCKSAKPSKYGLVAPFPLRTPVGQAEGLLNWASTFSKIAWASLYVDREPLHLESPGTLPPEAWPK